MKKYLIIIIAALLLLPLGAQARGEKGKMVFDESVFDFGTIKEANGPVSHEFEFINSGNGNLVIIDCTAQCGCTRPTFPKKPIAPGKRGKIKVTYNPAGRPGAFKKVVTVKNNGSPQKVKITIKGTVIPKNK